MCPRACGVRRGLRSPFGELPCLFVSFSPFWLSVVRAQASAHDLLLSPYLSGPPFPLFALYPNGPLLRSRSSIVRCFCRCGGRGGLGCQVSTCCDVAFVYALCHPSMADHARLVGKRVHYAPFVLPVAKPNCMVSLSGPFGPEERFKRERNQLSDF